MTTGDDVESLPDDWLDDWLGGDVGRFEAPVKHALTPIDEPAMDAAQATSVICGDVHVPGLFPSGGLNGVEGNVGSWCPSGRDIELPLSSLVALTMIVDGLLLLCGGVVNAMTLARATGVDRGGALRRPDTAGDFAVEEKCEMEARGDAVVVEGALGATELEGRGDASTEPELDA